jgi:hypothetical protein
MKDQRLCATHWKYFNTATTFSNFYQLFPFSAFGFFRVANFLQLFPSSVNFFQLLPTFTNFFRFPFSVFEKFRLRRNFDRAHK